MMTNPVFIVGMPRSGTTLLRLMLNSHSKIAISTETHYFTHFKMELFKRKRFFNHWVASKALVRLNRHWPSAVTKMIDLGFDERGILDVLKDFRFFKQSGLDTSQIEEHLTGGHKPYYNVYNAWLVSYAQRFGKGIFGDKTPVNGLFIKEILALYP
ncbi:MAG: sulfotransferase, partial [bacterium]|nr:sulfotransferase [bacterium]